MDQLWVAPIIIVSFYIGYLFGKLVQYSRICDNNSDNKKWWQ